MGKDLASEDPKRPSLPRLPVSTEECCGFARAGETAVSGLGTKSRAVVYFKFKTIDTIRKAQTLFSLHSTVVDVSVSASLLTAFCGKIIKTGRVIFQSSLLGCAHLFKKKKKNHMHSVCL